MSQEPFDAKPSKETFHLNSFILDCTCPACAYHVAVPFFNGGKQPLTTLAWPKSANEARAMKRLPLSFVRCVDCGHVYNKDFDYAEVPYSDKPNLMFNRGQVWQDHLKNIRDKILDCLPENPTVIEIGCGEGHLLRALAEARPGGRYIGFDPNAHIETGNTRVEAQVCLFDPRVHLKAYQPDLVISRHVMEHLMNPLGFMQSIAFSAEWEGLETRVFIEVPCIDRTFETARTVDFFYEHNSHFTSVSLHRLLTRCATVVELVERGYNDEVVYGFAVVGGKPGQIRYAQEALVFSQQSISTRNTVASQLDALHDSGKQVAVWGGTGKAAAFINHYGVDAVRFPLVVDSDYDKVGTFVPGMGQKIEAPDGLSDNPPDAVVITTQWRAQDIVLEMETRGIACKNILLEHEGRLIDYWRDSHPYKESFPSTHPHAGQTSPEQAKPAAPSGLIPFEVDRKPSGLIRGGSKKAASKRTQAPS